MYQAQLIKAAEGDDVTLQCRLDPPVSLSAFTVDWTRLENKDIVHVYRHQQDDPGPQTDQYRGRTTLLHEDLIRGVLTLHISSVKLSDRGPYKGFVPKLKTSCVVDLIVETVGKDQQNETKRDDSSTTGPPEEEETEPDGRGGGNRNAGRAGIISSVFVILCVVVVVVVVLLLRMNGTIHILTTPNGSEMKKVNTQAADEDLEGPAGSCLRNMV
ncbi:butyrophilin-like protein 2 [Micropterus salmoides]|uniref:butyrophilin-like protein 2 n=1 Tax=Micropterus salmoides TaxID=27706 RepID=UPI0018EDC3FF|nr:butyrophilin-like protein 2 [Micropterus salmoides]XP_038595602.1 butyrophilin-like protein 2 [Micropterus salmoides]